jgi:transcriptional regulator with PAS, ATPase and Fis domain
MRSQSPASTTTVALAAALIGFREHAGEATARAARLEARVRALTEELDARTGYRHVVGGSREWRQVLMQATQVGSTDTTVLLLGESGTGKEVVARFLHRASGRRSGPFIALNCAALPEQLLEAEVFGYERGAFTGAYQRKLGRFELVQGGTLFLDEIGLLRADVQAKLLRVLQERELERVGGTRAIKIDVRIVAATNADLKRAVAAGTFRDDLYYRLNVMPITVPPLRARIEDLPLLVDHFVRRYNDEFKKHIQGFTPEALSLLASYTWPGNVRELQNVVERAMVLVDGPWIGSADLPLDVTVAPGRSGPGQPTDVSRMDLIEASDRFERMIVQRVLEEVGGNVSEAARVLGLHRNSLRTRLARWKLGGAEPEDAGAQ